MPSLYPIFANILNRSETNVNQIELPEPDQAGLNHSEQLCRLIIDEIEHKGPISFSHYWQRAMFEPGLGYYSAGLAKIGQAGDFVTAPELGQVFGTCLANQLAEMMTHLTMPSLMELGAGTGALAATILNRLSELDTLPEAYLILEVSADLRQRQEQFLRQHCPEFLPIVQWLDQPPQNAWQGIVFGNEVVDALPANRYRYDNGQWQQLGVTYQNQRFAWSVIDIDPKDRGFLKQCSDPWPVKPTHYQTERQPKLDLWVTALTETLQKGYLFLIDYGYNNAEYYHPQRCDGTLICHYRHRAHDDPFVWPGLQDISVSVNFSAVAEAAEVDADAVSPRRPVF